MWHRRPEVRRRAFLAALVAALAATSAGAGDEARHEGAPSDALGYVYGAGVFAPEYTPPSPGTYALPVIDTIEDHPLLAADGRPTSLHRLKEHRVAVVALVYTTCAEATGCPLSNAVLQKVDRALAEDSALAGRVTLLTVSFDPERDTPERMRTMARLHAPRSDWRFATTRNEAELAPLLADFGQPVARLRFDDGAWTGLYRHVLKVFLLDGANRVRNVYSTGFLDPALVLADVRTVLLETAPRASP